MAITPCGVTVWVAARNAAAVRVTRDSVWNGSLSPSRTAITSKASPAAFASASTRGPSRRTRPGSRRWARRRKRRTTSLSGLEISWSEGFLSNLHQPSKGTAVAHGQVSQHLAVDLHSGLAKAVHQLAVLRHADALGDSFLCLELRHWLLLAPSWRPDGSAPGS